MIECLKIAKLSFGSSKLRINRGKIYITKKKKYFAIKYSKEKNYTSNIDCLRPRNGLALNFLIILNKRINKNVKAGTPITFKNIK